jgi:ATP-dependent exoDNAse (exonuclease V) beta subunit
MTIHQSKGLEFPIVLVPYLSASAAPKNPVVAYRAMSDGLPVSVLDVTATGKTPGAAMKKLLAESELQRNAYVALTRAQSRVVLWTWDAPKTKPAIRDHAWRAAHGDVGYPFAWDDRVADGVPEVMRPTFTLARAPFERHLPTPLESGVVLEPHLVGAAARWSRSCW